MLLYLDPAAFVEMAKARAKGGNGPGQLSMFGGGAPGQPPAPTQHAKHLETVRVAAHERHTDHGTVEVPSHTRLVMVSNPIPHPDHVAAAREAFEEMSRHEDDDLAHAEGGRKVNHPARARSRAFGNAARERFEAFPRHVQDAAVAASVAPPSAPQTEEERSKAWTADVMRRHEQLLADRAKDSARNEPQASAPSHVRLVMGAEKPPETAPPVASATPPGYSAGVERRSEVKSQQETAEQVDTALEAEGFTTTWWRKAGFRIYIKSSRGKDCGYVELGKADPLHLTDKTMSIRNALARAFGTGTDGDALDKAFSSATDVTPVAAPVAPPTERDQRIAAKVRERWAQSGMGGDPPTSDPAAYEAAAAIVDREMAAEAARATGGLRKETLRWSGHVTTSRKVGDVIHLNKKEWLVVTRATPPRMRTGTEADEDMGSIQQGEPYTAQDVHVRPATPEEIATETVRRQAVQDAKDAPKKAVAELRTTLRGDAWLPSDKAPAGVTWDAEPTAKNVSGPNQHGDRITRGRLADGTEVWHDSWRGGDDWRDTYYRPRTAQAVDAERVKNRAIAAYFVAHHGTEFARGMVQHQPGMTEGDIVPHTPEEKAAHVHGNAQAAKDADLIARLATAQTAGVLPPDLHAEARAHFAQPLPVDPRFPTRPAETRWANLQGNSERGAAVAGRHAQTTESRATPIDLEAEDSFGGGENAKFGLFGAHGPNKAAEAKWTALDGLETRLRDRGTLPHYAAQVQAMRDQLRPQVAATTLARMGTATKGGLKAAVEKLVAGQLTSLQAQTLREHLAEHPERVGDLPKKTQAALSSTGA